MEKKEGRKEIMSWKSFLDESGLRAEMPVKTCDSANEAYSHAEEREKKARPGEHFFVRGSSRRR